MLGILRFISGWGLSFEHFYIDQLHPGWCFDGILPLFFFGFRTIWKSYGHCWIFCCPAFLILLRTSRNGLTNLLRMWQTHLLKSRYLFFLFFDRRWLLILSAKAPAAPSSLYVLSLFWENRLFLQAIYTGTGCGCSNLAPPPYRFQSISLSLWKKV